MHDHVMALQWSCAIVANASKSSFDIGVIASTNINITQSVSIIQGIGIDHIVIVVVVVVIIVGVVVVVVLVVVGVVVVMHIFIAGMMMHILSLVLIS
jgi:hypothetical protein